MPGSSSQDDQQPLLARAASGDSQAAAACFERLGPRVVSLVRRFGFEGADADRAVRAIFRRLWSEAARRRTVGSDAEERLAVQVSRRWLLDRRARARVEGGAPPASRVALRVAASQPDLFGASAGIARALATLDPEDREILERVVVGGETYAGVAAGQDAGPADARERARRALVRVGEALHEAARS